MRLRYAWFVLGVLTMLPGCVMIQERTIECRNKTAAWWSWLGNHGHYADAGIPWYVRRHIGVGYRAGYMDVAYGGKGNVPLFPPDCYWGTWFQNGKGYEQVNAYFAGYQDGAVAARAEGIARWHPVPTSRFPMQRGGMPYYGPMEGGPEGEGVPLEGDLLFEEIPPSRMTFSAPPSQYSLTRPNQSGLQQQIVPPGSQPQIVHGEQRIVPESR